MAPIDGAARQHEGGPALPHEAGRRRFGQGGRAFAVRLAQDLNGTHQRSGGRHTLELEGVQEGRRPATDAGIVLAEILVGVELLRPRQCLGFGNAGSETFPGDHPGDRPEGVLLGLTGGDQRGADAGIKPHLVVDGPGIGLKGAGLPALRLAEHAADAVSTGKAGNARFPSSSGAARSSFVRLCVPEGHFVSSGRSGRGSPMVMGGRVGRERTRPGRRGATTRVS